MVRCLEGLEVGMFKVGSELFLSAGPDVVRAVKDRGFRVFLDLKFHDIPNTVAGAVAAAGRLGVDLLNVHASGGEAMMRAALAAARAGSPRLRLIAVTVLTSLAAGDLQRAGIASGPQEQVLCLATLAAESGLDGVVTSAAEAASLRARFPRPFLIVTPGIRPDWPEAGWQQRPGTLADQKRVATPAGALAAGADYIVVGRPITQAPDPRAAVTRILEELSVL